MNAFTLQTINNEGEVTIQMTEMSKEELEAGAQVTLQGVECDGSDVEPITGIGYEKFNLCPLYL